jgi:peptidoglycan/LPS O-acetylase OafA/YrhL
MLIHHGLMPGGWVGVDLFFVLSGFLITGILRREATHEHYWLSFYVKRATRILPPFLVLLLIAIPLAGHFRTVYAGYLLFASNIVQLSPLAIPLLGSLWSLAIEEHFYFFWPFAVRRLSREALLKVSVAIVLLSPLLRIAGTIFFRHIWGPHLDWDNPIFLLTPFRVDGLAAGAILALLLEDGRRPAFLQKWAGTLAAAATLSFFGLEAAFRSFRRTTDSLAFNGFGYSVVVLAAFFIVGYLVLRPNALFAKVLSSRAFVFVGTISYGVYLYQELVMHFTRLLAGPRISLKLLFIPDLLATIAIATASFYLLEKPIIGLGKAWLKKTPLLKKETAIAVVSQTAPGL